MKTLNSLTAATALGLALTLSTALQAQPGPGRRGPGGPPDAQGQAGRPDPATLAQHMATRYAELVTFDTNRDGQLDANEQATLAAKITDGSFEPRGPGGPNRPNRPERPNVQPENQAAHIATQFSKIAAYDANHDGQLDASEQTAVAAAITDGTLQPGGGPGRGPGGPGGRGGRGPGGPGGPEADRPPVAKEHLAERYAAVAAFDTNHDGQLTDSELTAVTEAVTAGTLQPPGPPRPEGDRPEVPAEQIAQRIASMYARLAAADVNHDGQLDATELENAPHGPGKGPAEGRPPGGPGRGNRMHRGPGGPARQ